MLRSRFGGLAVQQTTQPETRLRQQRAHRLVAGHQLINLAAHNSDEEAYLTRNNCQNNGAHGNYYLKRRNIYKILVQMRIRYVGCVLPSLSP